MVIHESEKFCTFVTPTIPLEEAAKIHGTGEWLRLLLSLYVFYGSSGGNMLKYQIMSLILLLCFIKH